jgi:hypothetical protein
MQKATFIEKKFLVSFILPIICYAVIFLSGYKLYKVTH